jgi:drug/metabolite transporter (DMT)-like permease
LVRAFIVALFWSNPYCNMAHLRTLPALMQLPNVFTFASALKFPSSTLSTGIRHMLMSTFFFAIMNVFIKKVSHLPSMEVVFFRCFVSMVLCAIVIAKDKIPWQGSNRKLLIARGVFGTISLYTFFLTLHEMPLGTAVTIQYLSPIFTTIIAIFLLNESVKPLQWLFFAISFAGVLVIKGFDSRISMLILAAGIISALSSGFAYNMVRSLKEKEHHIVVILHFQIVGVLAGLFFCLFSWQTPHGWDWLYLLMVGIFTQLGQINLTKALQMERISSVSILNYLGVIYALLFGFLFFGEHYALAALSGILLVIGGVMMNFIYTRITAKAVVEEELTTIEE